MLIIDIKRKAQIDKRFKAAICIKLGHFLSITLNFGLMQQPFQCKNAPLSKRALYSNLIDEF